MKPDNIGFDGKLFINEALARTPHVKVHLIFINLLTPLFTSYFTLLIVRGDVKIFDFGLARIMPQDGGNPYLDTYVMSGAGSPRYMSPECLMGDAYNLKADVYTFAIVLWQMLTGETPYFFVRGKDQLLQYVIEEGGRPEIEDDGHHNQQHWPTNIKRMMKSSFDADHENRPVR